MKRFACDAVSYRKGYIEISLEIHKNCINIETTQIHPDFEVIAPLLDPEPSTALLPDEAFVGNTELEMSLETAKNFLKTLAEYISDLERSNVS